MFPAVAHRKVDDAQTGRGAAGAHWHEIFTEYLSDRHPYPKVIRSPRQAESFLIDDLGCLHPRGSNRRLNHHHSDAAFEDGGRDEAACLGRRPPICQGDGGVADSQCRPRQHNDGGVIDNLRRPAARSVVRCASRVRSLAQLPQQLR